MCLVLVLSQLIASQALTERLVVAPTELLSYSRGADAVPIDAAAAGLAEGFELQLRGTFRGVQDHWAGYVTIPLGALALHGGYEWMSLAPVTLRRASAGAAWRLAEGAALGLSVRRFMLRRADATAVDLAVHLEPVSWLAVTAAVERVNAPALAGVPLERAYRVGAAVRPLWGAPWLTLGAETRLGGGDDDFAPRESRYFAELAPLEGVHVRAAYVPRSRELWFGGSVGFLGTELRAASQANSGDAQTRAGALALTLRARPRESLVRLTGRTVEVPLSGELAPAAGGLFSRGPSISTVALGLDELAQDPSVSRVILTIGALDIGLAAVEELRAAIGRLRDAGKVVVAELAGGGEREYLVAAAANRIRLDPSTHLVLDGFAVTLLYFARGLEKLGVRFDAVEVGRYKSGPDPLTRTSSRPEEREVVAQVLDQSLRTLTGVLMDERQLSAAQAQAVLAQGLWAPEEALRMKLVDELSQPLSPTEAPLVRERGERFVREALPNPRFGAPPRIQIIPIVGNIVGEAGDQVLPGGEALASQVISQLDAARQDADVVGAVLRVDSPGGEVYASELIWRSVRQLAAVKPVVVSMGDVAASGGYYVAAPAHAILAEPSTITGSIGIFTLKPDLSGLLDKAGITSEIFKVGPHADWSSITRGLSPEEREQVRRGLTLHYDAFVARVAAGRRMTPEHAASIAQGRVYTGLEALRLGLVDGLGGLADAVREVKARAGYSDDDLVALDIPEAAFSLSAALNGAVRGPPSLTGLLQEAWGAVSRLDGRALALMPFAVEVGP